MRTHPIILAALCLLGNCASAQEPQQAFSFQDKAIRESSGLAASRRYPGLLWTHNDSMNAPVLFLVNDAGQTVLTYNISGTENLDWEDMAISGSGEDAFLYIGDIGDNFQIRSALNIHRVREPKLDAAKVGQSQDAKDVESILVQYPDGAHDAESLLVSPDGRIFILTKAKDGKSRLYGTKTPFRAGTREVMEFLTEVQLQGTGNGLRATSADFSPDGKRLAVVTYKRIYEWTLPAAYDCGKLGAISATVRDLPELPQCEGICYSADGSRIFVSTEKEKTPVWAYVSPLVAKP